MLLNEAGIKMREMPKRYHSMEEFKKEFLPKMFEEEKAKENEADGK